ncbi:MAG: radical SAM protein [Nitrospirales bacterium]|nr:radical SAM protein [Nitrospirales bacterium]
MLLIHPPVAKPSEPPAGIARLSGMLRDHGVGHRLWDASLEGLIHLLGIPVPEDRKADRWSGRAFRNRGRNLSLMRDSILYGNRDKYSRTVTDLSRALSLISSPGITVGLANYEDGGLSPLRSADLIRAAEQPEESPFYPFLLERLEALFRIREPAFVGISLSYLSQALTAFALIGIIRRNFPGKRIILGGGLVTSWLRNSLWSNPFSGLVDYFVAGPGEEELLRILGVEKRGGKIARPDYSGFPLESYLSPGFILPYAASSGCYWSRCAFCPEEAEGNPYIAVPVPQVISALHVLTEETRPSLIHLLDNAVSPALLKALTDEEPGPPWYGFSRVGSHLEDLDFCISLRKAGCVMLKLGIESGDQGVLDALNKGIRVEAASRVLKNLKRAGISTYVYLLFGTPPETEEAARRTLDFTVRHSDCIGFLNLAIFNMPLCGTPASGLETRFFSEGDLSLYTGFVHPMGWDRKKVRFFLDRELRPNRAVAEIIRKDPPVFTSNHAAFMAMVRQSQA